MKKGLILAFSALLLAGCATKKDTKADQARVQARLQQYAGLLLKMDAAGIAAMFTPDGAMVNPSQPAVRGRQAIQKYLQSFSDYKVLSNSDEATSLLVDGDAAEQIGTYHESVRSPQGRLFEVSGRLEVNWARDASGEWYIAELGTFPGK